MPRDKDGRYTLPDIAISGSNVNRELTSTWQNETFTDIYNAINNQTTDNSITQLSSFDANGQTITTTYISPPTTLTNRLKIVNDLPQVNVPQGTLLYHDSRYGDCHHKVLESNIFDNNRNIKKVCQEIKTEHIQYLKK